MRRVAPRRLAVALPQIARGIEPGTVLARLQTLWPATAGPAVAASARPVGERDGIVTVACESAVWAQELELLAPDLVERLNASLEVTRGGRIKRLRFVVGSAPNDR